jgi:hypothetical protein
MSRLSWGQGCGSVVEHRLSIHKVLNQSLAPQFKTHTHTHTHIRIVSLPHSGSWPVISTENTWKNAWGTWWFDLDRPLQLWFHIRYHCSLAATLRGTSITHLFMLCSAPPFTTESVGSQFIDFLLWFSLLCSADCLQCRNWEVLNDSYHRSWGELDTEFIYRWPFKSHGM